MREGSSTDEHVHANKEVHTKLLSCRSVTTSGTRHLQTGRTCIDEGALVDYDSPLHAQRTGDTRGLVSSVALRGSEIRSAK